MLTDGSASKADLGEGCSRLPKRHVSTWWRILSLYQTVNIKHLWNNDMVSPSGSVPIPQ